MTRDVMVLLVEKVELAGICRISLQVLQSGCLFLATTQMSGQELSFLICQGVHHATLVVLVADKTLVSQLLNSKKCSHPTKKVLSFCSKMVLALLRDKHLASLVA